LTCALALAMAVRWPARGRDVIGRYGESATGVEVCGPGDGGLLYLLLASRVTAGLVLIQHMVVA
jgi:hypothetical protein